MRTKLADEKLSSLWLSIYLQEPGESLRVHKDIYVISFDSNKPISDINWTWNNFCARLWFINQDVWEIEKTFLSSKHTCGQSFDLIIVVTVKWASRKVRTKF